MQLFNVIYRGNGFDRNVPLPKPSQDAVTAINANWDHRVLDCKKIGDQWFWVNRATGTVEQA